MRSAVALGVAGLVVTLLGACGPTSAHLAIAEAQVALEAARGARAETYAVFEYTSAVEHLRKASEEEGYSDFDAAKDRDGDGIIDPDDQCPAVPEDRDGFQDHDGCPDPDNDQDGIADAADKCPLRPEDKDGFEDLNGCPDPDNDQDRIADTADKCPNQPEDYDGDADTDGCPDVFKRIVVTADRIELKQKVYFATAKSNIRKISFELLDEVAEALQQAPQLRVRIEGHTDSRGSAQYNRKLSEGRAQAVRRYLIERGIASDRLVAVGYGEERPIEDNQTRDGREANRRVEFHIIK
jgi:outer membrane protein OmpA-like peptidoglycan-associated protein